MTPQQEREARGIARTIIETVTDFVAVALFIASVAVWAAIISKHL